MTTYTQYVSAVRKDKQLFIAARFTERWDNELYFVYSQFGKIWKTLP